MDIFALLDSFSLNYLGDHGKSMASTDEMIVYFEPMLMLISKCETLAMS